MVRKDVPIADHPFLGPNLGSAALLAASVVVLALFFEETLDDADKKAARAGHRWMNWIFRFGRGKNNVRKGSWSSRWPTRSQTSDATNSSEDDEDDESTPREDTALLRTSTDGSADGQPHKDTKSVFRQLLQYNTVLVLLTYLVFQLANIGFNSLYPIFASAPPPTGPVCPCAPYGSRIGTPGRPYARRNGGTRCGGSGDMPLTCCRSSSWHPAAASLPSTGQTAGYHQDNA